MYYFSFTKTVWWRGGSTMARKVSQYTRKDILFPGLWKHLTNFGTIIARSVNLRKQVDRIGNMDQVSCGLTHIRNISFFIGAKLDFTVHFLFIFDEGGLRNYHDLKIKSLSLCLVAPSSCTYSYTTCLCKKITGQIVKKCKFCCCLWCGFKRLWFVC